MTHTLVRTVIALLEYPDHVQWGYDLSQRSGIKSGALHQVLGRLHAQGWLSDGWEAAEGVIGRPPRHFYTITDVGLVELAALLDRANRDPRFATLDFGAARRQ